MKSNKILSWGLLTLFIVACGGWITSQRVTLDPQNTVTITDTSATELVPALSGRIPVITTMSISTNTEQSIAFTSTGEELPTWDIPAYSPGFLQASDGVLFYGKEGQPISATCSLASTTRIYLRYRYQ